MLPPHFVHLLGQLLCIVSAGTIMLFITNYTCKLTPPCQGATKIWNGGGPSGDQIQNLVARISFLVARKQKPKKCLTDRSDCQLNVNKLPLVSDVSMIEFVVLWPVCQCAIHWKVSLQYSLMYTTCPDTKFAENCIISIVVHNKTWISPTSGKPVTEASLSNHQSRLRIMMSRGISGFKMAVLRATIFSFHTSEPCLAIGKRRTLHALSNRKLHPCFLILWHNVNSDFCSV